MFFKLAVSNIFKHWKRSLVVFIAVVLAVIVLSLIGGVLRGFTSTIMDSILPASGHLTIKAAGAKDAVNPMDLKYLLPGAEDILAQVKLPGVVRAEKVITFGAVLLEDTGDDLTKDVHNLKMLGSGLSPQTGFFKNIRDGITQGQFLPDGKGILVSEKAAKLLNLRLGGPAMLLVQDRNNNPWNQQFTVTGIFKSGSDLVDEGQFFLSHASAEELVDATGLTREIRLVLDDAEKADAVKAQLDKIFAGQNLEIETWRTSLGMLTLITNLLNMVAIFIRLIFIVIATSVIANSVLMAIFERVREYGTLRAIGLKRKQLFWMITSEGLVLGLAGALAGLAIGIPWLLILSKTGLDVGSATEYIGFASLIYPAFSWFDGLLNLVVGVLIAFLSSFFAARTINKLSVTQALTHL